MLKPLLQTAVKRFFGSLGYEVRKKNRRLGMLGCLQNAVNNGLNPKTIIDVGVAEGTQDLYRSFPNARHLLIEPLEEYRPHLESIVSGLKDASYIIAAATNKSGNAVINVHPDLVGSSLYLENEDSDVNGTRRTVPALTLDQICHDHKAEGPYLLKIDTQGAELDVLRGASTILHYTDFIILEVCLLGFFDGGPQFYDCITFLKDRGFVVYDIFDTRYRPLDNAMSQADIAFVRERSQFRTYHYYATRTQREAQNAALQRTQKLY